MAGHTSILENENGCKIKFWGGGGLCFSFGTHLNDVAVSIEI